MIDNFENLKNFMKFEPGTYYKFVALVRAKDFADGRYEPVLSTNERGEIFVRQWFVDSEDSLDRYKDDMINLCKATKARLYVTTDRKSTKKTILTMAQQLDDYIRQLINNPNAPISIKKLSKFSASASQMAECSSGPKYWLIDIDGNGLEEDKKLSIISKLYACFICLFIGKEVIENDTPNGKHFLVERTFDIKSFIKSYMEKNNEDSKLLLDYKNNWEIKENALTLVYEGLH